MYRYGGVTKRMANDYFISIIYPEYNVGVPIPGAHRIDSGSAELGHTGLAYVNGTTGEIRYFDYGRYEIEDSTEPDGSRSSYGIIVEPLVEKKYWIQFD